MTKIAFLLTIIATALASMPAHAQQRMFVSGHGLDTRACRQLNGRISFSPFWCVACNFRIRGNPIAQVSNPAERRDSQSAQ